MMFEVSLISSCVFFFSCVLIRVNDGVCSDRHACGHLEDVERLENEPSRKFPTEKDWLSVTGGLAIHAFVRGRLEVNFVEAGQQSRASSIVEQR